MQIELPRDEDGYLGCECPNCGNYFKFKTETAKTSSPNLCCPYCGNEAMHGAYITSEQREYVQSVMRRYVFEQAHQMFKGLERQFPKHKAKKTGVYVKASRSPDISLYIYEELQLETRVRCTNCSLEYAVYGVFGYCPVCALHNSQQILDTSLDVITKMLGLAATEGDKTIAEELIAGSLSNVVAKFDGFGREVCRVFADKTSNPAQAADIRFQNLTGAQNNVQKHFGFDIAGSLTPDEWTAAIRGFQKRHLLAHSSGVIDAEYIKKANDPSAVEGRKVTISIDEVTELIAIIRKLSAHIIAEMGKLP